MRYIFNVPNITDNSPILLDLFAGAGGTGLGSQAAGFRIVGAVEINKNAAQTYTNNLHITVEQSDIRALSAVNLREKLGLKRGQLDVLVGCPPCQGFTRMRNANGASDPRNDLVLQYISYVKEFRPRFAVFENVPGLVRSKHGKAFYKRLCDELKKLNYAIFERMIDAADYGVPQHRRRIIVIAGRDQEIPPYPEATHSNPSLKKGKRRMLDPWVSVEKAISDFPVLVSGQDGTKGGEYPNHIAPKMSDEVLKFIKKVPQNGGSRTDVAHEFWLPCHINHSGHKDVYGRISWSKPSNTITSGCTNVSRGRFIHPTQDRGLTPREAAALQSFPDNFIFYGRDIPAQIGNAVPPLLAYKIMLSLMKRIIEVPLSHNNHIENLEDNPGKSDALDDKRDEKNQVAFQVKVPNFP
jgi:DNA (cytosine-5)-methyltransferase 1